MRFTAMLLLSMFAAETSQGQQTGWKEMDDFSVLSGKVFHSAESGNLKPARDSATVILRKAAAWQLSAIPAFCNATAIRPLLDKLVSQCTDIRDAVQANKRDQDLRTLVSRAHHTFHQIPGNCNVSPQ
ncbi:MAG TPA: hypothetical protein VMI35_14390 [Puia sp.]|nr:hypothetical protein [Puia sp.]